MVLIQKYISYFFSNINGYYVGTLLDFYNTINSSVMSVKTSSKQTYDIKTTIPDSNKLLSGINLGISLKNNYQLCSNLCFYDFNNLRKNNYSKKILFHSNNKHSFDLISMRICIIKLINIKDIMSFHYTNKYLIKSGLGIYTNIFIVKSISPYIPNYPFIFGPCVYFSLSHNGIYANLLMFINLQYMFNLGNVICSEENKQYVKNQDFDSRDIVSILFGLFNLSFSINWGEQFNQLLPISEIYK